MLSALGASRARIVRQLLTESAILSFAGALAGVLIAVASLRALTALMPAGLADVSSPQLDIRVFGFAVALALFTGLGFGLWPAFGAARADAQVPAREHPRRSLDVVFGVVVRSAVGWADAHREQLHHFTREVLLGRAADVQPVERR